MIYSHYVKHRKQASSLNRALLDFLEPRLFLANTAPAAFDDVYSTPVNVNLTISAPGILSNDTDVDSDSLTAIVVTQPNNGVLTLNPDGSFVYEPFAEYHGADTFSYIDFDGTDISNFGTVTIQVNTPTVARDDAYMLDEDTTISLNWEYGELANDIDENPDIKTPYKVTDPSHGVLTLDINGSFSYTPDANYNGTDSFTYNVFDGYAYGNTATVVLTINPVDDMPVGNADVYWVNEDETLTEDAQHGVLANDNNIDGNTMTAVMVSDVSHGELTLNADGSFTYVPAANYNGPDSFTYFANNGAVTSDLMTVTINVISVNDIPAATGESYVIAVNGSLNKNAAEGLLANDGDPEGDPIAAIKVSDPLHGVLTLNADGSFIYAPNADYHGTDSFTYKVNDTFNDSKTVTVNILMNTGPDATADAYWVDEDGTLTKTQANGVTSNDIDIDDEDLTVIKVSDVSHGDLALNADGSFTYVPDANYHGTDSFSYKVYDGYVYSNIVVVSLTINTINDIPVAVGDAFSTDEDTTLTMDAEAGLLANDSDVEEDPLAAFLVEDVIHGDLTFNSDGSFMYVPEADYYGIDSFTYRVYDGMDFSPTVTVTLTINTVNDPSVGVNDDYETDEDTLLAVNVQNGVLANDYDAESDPLEAILVSGPSHGVLTLYSNGSFDYAPTANYVGTDSFTYVVNDGESATVNLTINATNDAPVGKNKTLHRNPGASAVVSLKDVFTDSEGDALSFVIKSKPKHGKVSIHDNGTPLDASDDYAIYIPDSGYYFNDSFVIEASDGEAHAHGAISIIASNIGLSPNPSNSSKNDLIVIGSNAKDAITLTPSGSKVKVAINGVNKGSFNPTGKIMVNGLAGNDVIDASKLNKSVQIFGGGGNDVIKGSSKVCRLSGGLGYDSIFSRNAKDLVTGAEFSSLLD
jgi:VCBS repeat-containing protein